MTKPSRAMCIETVCSAWTRIVFKRREGPSTGMRFHFDSFIQDLFVSGALLDKRGRIIEVNDGWKQFARAGRLDLEDYAVGHDYLKHAVFADASSVAILRGLKGVLNGQIDVFSTIYPCGTPAAPRWFVLLGFGVDNHTKAAAAVLHIDISRFLQNRNEISASMIGVGGGALDPAIEKLTRAVRETIATSIQNSAVNDRVSSDAREQKIINSLTAHQLILLSHLARGATNSEIAKVQNISVGSVKNQTAALLRKLGVANRTQAALLAVRNRLVDGVG